MDFQQVALHDVEVTLRRDETFVAEHLLDAAQVRAVLEHVAGELVTEAVRGEERSDARARRVDLHLRFPPALGHRLARAIKEERGAVAGTPVLPQQRAHGAEVFSGPRERAFPERHDALGLAFALADGEQAFLGVEVIDRHRAQFRDARRAAPQHLKDGPVAEPDHRLHVRDREQPAHFVGFKSTAGNRCGARGSLMISAGLSAMRPVRNRNRKNVWR